MLVQEENGVSEILTFFKEKEKKYADLGSEEDGTQSPTSYSFVSHPRPLATAEKKIYVKVSRKNSSETDKTSQKRKQLIVAKKRPLSTQKKQEEIPLSVLTRKIKGPKVDLDGNIMQDSILGSPEDFVNMKRQIIGDELVDDTSKQTNVVESKALGEQFNGSVGNRGHNMQISTMQYFNTVTCWIFERTELLKQERALQRWKETNRMWDAVKHRLSSQVGKSEAKLVVTQTDSFRKQVEQKEVFEREKFTKHHDTKIDPLWNPVTVANSGLWVHKAQHSEDSLETIIRSSPTNDTNLEVIGQTLLPSNKHDIKPEEYQLHPSSPVGKQQETVVATAWIDEQNGPQLKLDKEQLYFQGRVGSALSSTVTVSNTGSTAIYFTWKQLKNPDPLKRALWFQQTQNEFYFSEESGVLLQNESKKFTFSFKSEMHGIFFATWELVTRPPIRDQTFTVHLQGIAVQDDVLKESRTKIEKKLQQQEIWHGVQDIIHKLISSLTIPPPQKYVLPPIAVDPYELNLPHLIKANSDLQLFFSKAIYESLEKLLGKLSVIQSNKVKWNFSLLTLHQIILQVEDQKVKTELLRTLNEIMSMAAFPPSGGESPSLQYRIGYDLLLQLVEKIPFVAREERQRVGLPSKRFSVPNLYKEDEDARLRMSFDPKLSTHMGISSNDKIKDTLPRRKRRSNIAKSNAQVIASNSQNNTRNGRNTLEEASLQQQDGGNKEAREDVLETQEYLRNLHQQISFAKSVWCVYVSR